MMKRVLLIFVTVCFMVGCASDDPLADKLKKIENSIDQNALGQDINYKAIQATVERSVSVATSLKDWSDMLEVGQTELPETLKKIDAMIDRYRTDNDAVNYHVWKFKYQRVTKALSMNYDELFYEVIKHKYSIDNPLFNNTHVEVTNYYFFDGVGNLLFSVSDTDMKSYVLQYIKTDLSPYETAFYHQSVL